MQHNKGHIGDRERKATMADSSDPWFAPHDPTLPAPWKGVIMGTVQYYWNPDTNVTQHERPTTVATATPLLAGPPIIGPAGAVPQSALSQGQQPPGRLFATAAPLLAGPPIIGPAAAIPQPAFSQGQQPPGFHQPAQPSLPPGQQSGQAPLPKIWDSNMAHMQGNNAMSAALQDSLNSWTNEETRLWNIVSNDSWDYNSWLAFLAEVRENYPPNYEKMRYAYKQFLVFYPLDLNQIKTFANIEKDLDVNYALGLYEAGNECLKYSVEYWLQFYQLAVSVSKDYDYIHKLLTNAVAYVGSYYTSKQLWELAIKFEEMHLKWSNVSYLYSQIFEHSAVKDLDVFFSRFKELVNSKPLINLLCLNDSWGGITQRLKELPEKEGISEYIRMREISYFKARLFQAEIAGYEALISRYTFQPEYVEDSEAGVWLDYLDFIESKYPIQAVTLYKRCLIPCATRGDIWMRFIDYLFEHQQPAGEINSCLNSALLFTEKKDYLNMWLLKARYLEFTGDYSDALKEYRDICSSNRYLIKVLQAHANLEHRLGDNFQACAVFEEAIDVEKQKGDGSYLPALLLEYSRFALLVLENTRKSKDILTELLLLELTKPVIEGVIALACSFPQKERMDFVQHIDTLVGNFVIPDHSKGRSRDSDKIDTSLLYLEFLDHFATQELIETAVKRHHSRFCGGRMLLSKRRSDSSKNTRAAKNVKLSASDPIQENVIDIVLLTLEEFLKKDPMIEDVLVNVGILKGKATTKLTDIGRRLLRALYDLLRKRHALLLSWNGVFSASDIMVTFDPSTRVIICSFKKQPAKTDANWMAWTDNDNTTMKNIVHPFYYSEVTKSYPIYLSVLFKLLESRPLNIGSHTESRNLFLERIAMQPVFRAPYVRICLCRDLYGYLKEVLQFDHGEFSRIFSFVKCDIGDICSKDDLVNEVFNFGKKVVVGNTNLVELSRCVELIRHFDSHALDHLKKLMVVIISLEELIHVADYHFSEVICTLVENLCHNKNKCPRLHDIYRIYSESD